MAKKAIIYIVFSIIIGSSTLAADWKYYGETGPENWDELYPTCGGDNQSPINIVRYEAQRKTMGEFIFVGFDDMPDDAVFVLENNGHTVSLGITGEFYIFGGGLPAKYKVVELHFHWDNLGIRGSEHAIDGMKYPLEMHLVSYNSEKYKDLTEAKMHSEGLAVLGTVIHIGGHDNEDYEPLLSGFHKVIYPGQTHTYSESFSVLRMVSHDTSNFFRYKGSLTTPTCNEAVVWTVFRDHQRISQRQFDEFLSLKSTYEGSMIDVPLGDNYRPIQPIGKRHVYARVAEENHGNTGCRPFNYESSIILASLAVLLNALLTV